MKNSSEERQREPHSNVEDIDINQYLEDDPEAATLDDLSGELEDNVHERETVRNENLMPDRSVRSSDSDGWPLKYRARMKAGNAVDHSATKLGGIIGANYSTFQMSEAGYELMQESLNLSGISDIGASLGFFVGWLTTVPLMSQAAVKASDKAANKIRPDWNEGKGHLVKNEKTIHGEKERSEYLNDLLKESKAVEMTEITGTDYQLDRGVEVAWNSEYLSSQPNDIFYNIAWKYNEEEDETIYEVDTIIKWQDMPVELDEINIDDLDIWRFRGVKSGHPDEIEEIREISRNAGSAEQQEKAEEYFEEAYELLEETGVTSKEKPFEESKPWRGRRKGYQYERKLDNESN